MNPREADEEASNKRLERLPPSAEQANGQESLRTALAITRRVHRANPAFSPAIHPDSGEVWRLSEEIKLLEAQALDEWASAANLLFDAADFTRRWLDLGGIEGGEHQVLSASGIVYKRNNLLYHTSYLEYVERLILHNWLFPDTYYTFLGLMWVRENDDEFVQLRPVTSQQAFRAVRGATRAEVKAEMGRMDFVRRYEDNYVHPDLHVFVEDLHDQNVLVDADGDLLIFDPVIYVSGPGMKN